MSGSEGDRAYRKRGRWLKELGYSSYDEYLQSGLWRGIRRRVEGRDRRKCYACGARGWQVHHLRYTQANMAGRSLGYMVLLCGGCHTRVHWASDGGRRKLASGYNLLRRWREEAGLRPRALPRGKKVRRQEKLVMCPTCNVNRRYRSGECPPCRRVSRVLASS